MNKTCAEQISDLESVLFNTLQAVWIEKRLGVLRLGCSNISINMGSRIEIKNGLNPKMKAPVIDWQSVRPTSEVVRHVTKRILSPMLMQTKDRHILMLRKKNETSLWFFTDESCCLTIFLEWVSSSPGFSNAIPAFILIGASCCQFAAKCDRELKPVLPHFPQFAGEIWHLRTETSRVYVWSQVLKVNQKSKSHPKF